MKKTVTTLSQDWTLLRLRVSSSLSRFFSPDHCALQRELQGGISGLLPDGGAVAGKEKFLG
jgi:hypothetical protein